MEYLSHTEHLCYVRCNFCSTVLAVGVPCRRAVDTVTVKCGYCNCLSFLSTRPLFQPQQSSLDLQMSAFQGFGTGIDYRKGQSSMSSSTTSSLQQQQQQPISSNAPYVVKPPERKHRLPSAYNRFMKEEIQRIKAANPEIPHRVAFSTAAKNWARYIPHPSTASTAESNKNERRSNGCGMENVADATRS